MTPPDSMEVMFTCRECRLERVAVPVRLRRVNESITKWVEEVGQACGDRHMLLSPLCTCRKVDLLIPLSKESDEDHGIGHLPSPLPSTAVLDEKDLLRSEDRSP